MRFELKKTENGWIMKIEPEGLSMMAQPKVFVFKTIDEALSHIREWVR